MEVGALGKRESELIGLRPGVERIKGGLKLRNARWSRATVVRYVQLDIIGIGLHSNIGESREQIREIGNVQDK